MPTLSSENGYFVWYKINGRTSCAKIAKEQYGATIDKTADGFIWRSAMLIQSVPLTAEQWNMKLDELALLFPYPGMLPAKF